MQEQSRYAVGIDIGTKTVRCVVGYIGESGVPKIVGTGLADNSGMQKGVVAKLNGPAAAIDKALETAERMSGHQVDQAFMSVNGAHIISTKADGMIAVNAQDGEVTQDDIYRLEEVATTGKVPENREILEVIPHAYRLDGQDNIKDPLGMSGTRLELKANVVSGLAPYITNVRRSAELAKVQTVGLAPSVLAAAKTVLGEQQLENGVAVLDIGAATTGVAVFESGDLQHVAVIPMGGQHVTNDVAIGLKIDPEVAEQVKLEHAALGAAADGVVDVKIDGETQQFEQSVIGEIVGARYEEIFELAGKELKRAGGIGRLPSGVVLVGGGVKIAGIVPFAKECLGVAAKIGVPAGYAGVSDDVAVPEFAAAVGLMLLDVSAPAQQRMTESGGQTSGAAAQKAGGLLRNLLAKFK